MERMWNELAEYYDMQYVWKPYRTEAGRIASLVRKYKKSPGTDLLDVGCGTGEHIRYLKRHFRIVGTDASERMLRIARRKFPPVTFLRQDMTTLRIGKRFDVIVSLFASIAYARTYANLRRTIEGFSEHLVKGGVVIIDPFVHPRLFNAGHFDGLYVDRPDVKLCRLVKSTLRGSIATLDCHFLIATRAGIRSYRDVHRMGCFAPERVLKIMEDCGLRSHYFSRGLMPARGLYVGVK